MWGMIKALAVAAAVGAGAGVLAKMKIDTAVNGEGPKKLSKKKYRVIELPEDFDVDEVEILGRRKGKDKKDDTSDSSDS